MWACHGGRIVRMAGHAGSMHGLTYLTSMSAASRTEQRVVRSYHAFGIAETGEDGLFEVIVRAEDGSIEGVRTKDGGMLGVMWHPEREWPIHPEDRAMLRRLFGWNGERSE